MSRKAICIADRGATLDLHISTKEPSISTPAESIGEPSEVVPVRLSPLGRLHYALRDVDDKADWDPDILSRLAEEESCRSVQVRRVFASEARREGWDDLFEKIDLSTSEKAWIKAHEAASQGDLEGLLASLQTLPSTGYEARVQLVLPYLEEIDFRDESWGSLLEGWVAAGLTNASELHDFVVGDEITALRSAPALMQLAGNEGRSKEWADAAVGLIEGKPGLPITDKVPTWAALAAYTKGIAGENVDAFAHAIATLPLDLVDDLIDRGSLSASAELETFGMHREYVCARVDPGRLDEFALRRLGHEEELARRYFMARNTAGLRTLTDSVLTSHYLGLLDVLDGKPADGRVRTEALVILQVLAEYRTELAEERAPAVPQPILIDPSLWPALAQQARDGLLPTSEKERAQNASFAQWCDVQRLLGLLWQREWTRAIDLADALLGSAPDERLEDEILNLTAFALRQLDRSDEAASLLEKALQGEYTEALLVNTSIVAAEVDVAKAASLLARLVKEAPTHELRVAAMTRAISVWSATSDTEFPADLVGSLQLVLQSDISLPDYCNFIQFAVVATPKVVTSLTQPSGECAGPFRLARARVRFFTENQVAQADLAKEFIGVYRDFGRTAWFDLDWSRLLDLVKDSTFVDFGDGMGSAVFFDTVYADAPELLTQFEQLLFMPQAGAHMAAYFAREGGCLAEQAFTKFFFLPAEELLSSIAAFDGGATDFLARNLAKTMTLAALGYLDSSRDNIAGQYNQRVERLRWDQETRYAILREMRTLLDQANGCLEHLDRVADRLQRLPLSESERRLHLDALTGPTNEWRREVAQLRAQL